LNPLRKSENAGTMYHTSTSREERGRIYTTT
jgi:hypothetical protein